jgi:hypothetical protein
MKLSEEMKFGVSVASSGGCRSVGHEMVNVEYFCWTCRSRLNAEIKCVYSTEPRWVLQGCSDAQSSLFANN